MRIRFYIDPETELPHIFNHTVTEEEVMEVRRMSNNYPPGWDEERVRRVLAHYEQQSEEEAVAEDEAAFKQEGQTFIEIPNELLPKILELIARKETGMAGEQ